MSWVTPPGIALTARSARAAAFGCLARCRHPGAKARRGVEQLHDAGVDLGSQPVDGGFALAGDAVDGAGLHAAADQLSLDRAGVEQQPAVQSLERGDDAV